MTLKEAIESGKRFKRKEDSNWVDVSIVHDSSEWFYIKDVLADDWITEEPAKQKVTMWSMLIKNESGDFYVTQRLVANESEAKKYCAHDVFIKLVNPIEVEV